MRYYHVIFNTSSEEIKEKAKVNLREYSYDSPIASVNNYMYRNLQKELSFLAYQEEENLVYAVFAFLSLILSFYRTDYFREGKEKLFFI